MSKRSSIVHVEWRSRNLAKLKEFYRAAFRWKFDDSMPGYMLVDAGKGEFGVGFAQIDAGSAMQPGVVAFLESDDLGASETAIREAGGHIVGSPQDVPGWGRFSLFTDPDGNPMGLWQSADKVKKEEKRAKKAEKKRVKAATEAAPPADASTTPDADKAARKAEKDKAKAEKDKQKSEKKAQKLAAKAEKKAKKTAKKAEKSVDENLDVKTEKKAKKQAQADRPREDADR